MVLTMNHIIFPLSMGEFKTSYPSLYTKHNLYSRPSTLFLSVLLVDPSENFMKEIQKLLDKEKSAEL